MLGPIVYPPNTVFEPSAVRNGASPHPGVREDGADARQTGVQTPNAVKAPDAALEAKQTARDGQREPSKKGEPGETKANPATRSADLSQEERARVQELQERDREVRAHELAHAAAAGRHGGSPRYDYERGPDGRLYAVEGEVPIDVSPVRGDPEATLRKMEQVKRAALAPANPSPKDRQVASLAARRAAEARRDVSQRALDSLLEGDVPDAALGIPAGRRSLDGNPGLHERAVLSAQRYVEQAPAPKKIEKMEAPPEPDQKLASGGSVRPSPAVS